MLKQIGGLMFGTTMGIGAVMYMDDVVYVPLRRAFVKPISSFYVAKYSTADEDGVDKTPPIPTISELAYDLTYGGYNFLKEMKPIGVTSDSVKDYIKDQDFVTREQHYFDYIRKMKETVEETKQDIKEDFFKKQRHEKQDYENMKNLSFGDIYRMYESGKSHRTIDVDKAGFFSNMVKIVPKEIQEERKLSKEARAIKAELMSAKAAREAQGGASDMLKQSRAFQMPDERKELLKNKQQLNELGKIIDKSKGEDLSKERVLRLLQEYEKSPLRVNELEKKDLVRLNRLRKLAQKYEKEDRVESIEKVELVEEKQEKTDENSNNNTQSLEGSSNEEPKEIVEDEGDKKSKEDEVQNEK